MPKAQLNGLPNELLDMIAKRLDRRELLNFRLADPPLFGPVGRPHLACFINSCRGHKGLDFCENCQAKYEAMAEPENADIVQRFKHLSLKFMHSARVQHPTPFQFRFWIAPVAKITSLEYRVVYDRENEATDFIINLLIDKIADKGKRKAVPFPDLQTLKLDDVNLKPRDLRLLLKLQTKLEHVELSGEVCGEFSQICQAIRGSQALERLKSFRLEYGKEATNWILDTDGDVIGTTSEASYVYEIVDAQDVEEEENVAMEELQSNGFTAPSYNRETYPRRLVMWKMIPIGEDTARGVEIVDEKRELDGWMGVKALRAT